MQRFADESVGADGGESGMPDGEGIGEQDLLPNDLDHHQALLDSAFFTAALTCGVMFGRPSWRAC